MLIWYNHIGIIGIVKVMWKVENIGMIRPCQHMKEMCGPDFLLSNQEKINLGPMDYVWFIENLKENTN